MIKIIENTMSGPVKAKCGECGSVFSYEYSDIMRYEDNCFLGGRSVVRYLICPVCKSDLKFKNQLIGLKTDIQVVDEIKGEISTEKHSKGEQP